MKKKHSKWYWLQMAHEARMWAQDVAVASMIAAAYLHKHPEAKCKLEAKIEELKAKFKK